MGPAVREGGRNLTVGALFFWRLLAKLFTVVVLIAYGGFYATKLTLGRILPKIAQTVLFPPVLIYTGFYTLLNPLWWFLTVLIPNSLFKQPLFNPYLQYLPPEFLDKTFQHDKLDIVLDSWLVFTGIRVNLYWFQVLTKNALQKLIRLSQLLGKLSKKCPLMERFFPQKGFCFPIRALVAIIASFIIVIFVNSIAKNSVLKPKTVAKLDRAACYSQVFATNPARENQAAHFDSNSTTCVVDNCANCHIWNDKSLFLPETLHEPLFNSAISTVNEEPVQANLIGDIKLSWTCNEGKPYTIKLKDCLYLPASPVNIISVPDLFVHLNDDEGTWIQSKSQYSTFA